MQISIATIKGEQGATLPFEFSIAEEDLDPLADGVVLAGPVDVRGAVTNTGSSMLVQATASAPVELQCARCLQPVPQLMEAVVAERFRSREDSAFYDGEDAVAEDDDVSYYERDRIDVGEVVRENFALQIPMKPVCDEACRGLCPQCGVNWNVQSCTCTPDDTDPRLAVLREWQARHDKAD